MQEGNRVMLRISMVLAIAMSIAAPARADDDRSRVEFSRPGTVCLPLDADVRAKIESGDLRLVLGISKYAPSGGEATILASLVHSSDGSAQELARAAMYPGGDFSTSAEEPARRFEVPFRAADARLSDLYASCIRVELVDSNGELNQGSLEGYIELVGKDG